MDRIYEFIMQNKERCIKKDYSYVENLFLYSINNPINFFDLMGLNCYSAQKCMDCFYYNSENDYELNNAIFSIQWGCATGKIKHKGCKGTPPGWKCCGFTDMKTKIYITDENGVCPTCLTILHEMYHFLYKSDKEDAANDWAKRHLPICCPEKFY